MSVVPEWARQCGYGVRLEWGRTGAEVLGPGCAAVVVVDVLSFSTAVSVAVDAGTQVLPYRWRDATAAAFAAAEDAELAVGRSAVTADRPWSLSPAVLRRAPGPPRLVLPSPNGSAIASAVAGTPVIAGCLRNATAVARWIVQRGWATAEKPIAVIPAGEHWPGGEGIRPAIEDWLGAGAVVAALTTLGAGPCSPEAESAAATYDGADVGAIIAECASARELRAAGFAEDVAIAVELASSTAVPVLRHRAFRDES
ncbi:2-phosphosulfolactate phosphatase [Nocardia rhizosphaerae]|uniref:Probable 2-phosphosulfolactate phosphatase n=1 Tax=Nocardia rhizosphaerae TaxID=1691571 RepID=A0ABV8LBK2_9NOCA